MTVTQSRKRLMLKLDAQIAKNCMVQELQEVHKVERVIINYLIAVNKDTVPNLYELLNLYSGLNEFIFIDELIKKESLIK